MRDQISIANDLPKIRRIYDVITHDVVDCSRLHFDIHLSQPHTHPEMVECSFARQLRIVFM